MRKRLHHRLRELEQVQARARKLVDTRDQEIARDQALSRFKLFLRMRGVDQGPNESLVEASARALEISCRELRKQLEVGIDPIHKWFADHGILEEVERRKAAGTWPTAGGSEAVVRL